MNFTINGKQYNFGAKFTRVVDNGREIFVHNAPGDISDDRARTIIDGSGVPDWGYMSVPKDKLDAYQVKEEPKTF